MHSYVTFLFVLSLVVAARAGEESKGRRGPEINPANIMFPACEPFIDAWGNSIDNLLKSKQIGPGTCPEGNSREDCTVSEYMKIRCSVDEVPSEECVAQLNAYLQGNTCNK